MEKLRQYRKMLKITCLQVSSGSNADYFTFEVRFEQQQPHNLFKYSLTKHKQELLQLYQRLEQCIFDMDNPFSASFSTSLSQQSSQVEAVNESLRLCMSRIDVITNSSFVAFFSLHLHYDDFVNCLKQDSTAIEEKIGDISTNLQQSARFGGNVFCTDKPWLKAEKTELLQKELAREHIIKQGSQKGQKQKEVSQFDRMKDLVSLERECELQLNDSQVLDFTFVRYYQAEMLYVLQQPKNTIKLKNFFKSMFSQANQLGYLSIHCRQDKVFSRTQSMELLAQPISMNFNEKTNMLFICTGVGVYIYLSRVESKLQQIDIFAFVELPQTATFAANIGRAELYLLTIADPQLHVYSINREQLQKTQYRYKKAGAICYEESSSRLFVGEVDKIHVYSVVDYLEIKKLHEVKVDCLYSRIVENHGYLFGLSDKGFMTVIELKPQGKEHLISVTTAIDLPQGSTQLVGSLKNRRLIITSFRNCLVLIDTMEGPFASVRLNLEGRVQTVFSDREKGEVLALSPQGHLTVLRLIEAIR